MLLDDRKIGLLEDDPIMGESLLQRLQLEGAEVQWWRSGAEALEGIAKDRPEAVICDMRLPDMSGEDVFKTSAGMADTPPFLFISAYGDIDLAVRLLRSGAGDYITKPFDMSGFLQRLSGLLPRRTGIPENALGTSGSMVEVARTLRRVAKLGSTVLLVGETGVGKEVCAGFLHRAAGGDGPFMAVNCAAIPAELMEAELFGHEKGAFTGAQARHAGYAERAGTGTLFLDEIGDLALPLQAKLLRLLEDRTFFRVGGEKSVPFKARVVCATNANLQKRIEAGTFREDLYYRVNVISVAIPPLRDRSDDIPSLLEVAFDQFNDRFDAGLRGVSSMTEEAAIAHPWPGNVRELRNRMERAVAMAGGPWIMPGDLFPDMNFSPQQGAQLGTLEDARTEAERRHIARALALSENEMAHAAKLLNISRTTLWEKMKRLGMSPRSEN